MSTMLSEAYAFAHPADERPRRRPRTAPNDSQPPPAFRLKTPTKPPPPTRAMSTDEHKPLRSKGSRTHFRFKRHSVTASDLSLSEMSKAPPTHKHLVPPPPPPRRSTSSDLWGTPVDDIAFAMGLVGHRNAIGDEQRPAEFLAEAATQHKRHGFRRFFRPSGDHKRVPQHQDKHAGHHRHTQHASSLDHSATSSPSMSFSDVTYDSSNGSAASSDVQPAPHTPSTSAPSLPLESTSSRALGQEMHTLPRKAPSPPIAAADAETDGSGRVRAPAAIPGRLRKEGQPRRPHTADRPSERTFALHPYAVRGDSSASHAAHAQRIQQWTNSLGSRSLAAHDGRDSSRQRPSTSPNAALADAPGHRHAPSPPKGVRPRLRHDGSVAPPAATPPPPTLRLPPLPAPTRPLPDVPRLPPQRFSDAFSKTPQLLFSAPPEVTVAHPPTTRDEGTEDDADAEDEDGLDAIGRIMGLYHLRSSSTTGSFLSSSEASSSSSHRFSVRPDSPLVLPPAKNASERRELDTCRTPTLKASLLPSPERKRPSAMKKAPSASFDSTSSLSLPTAGGASRRVKTVKFATESWSSFEALTDDEDTEDTEEEEEALEEHSEDDKAPRGTRSHRKSGDHCREPSQSWDDETEAIVMEFLNLNSQIRARPVGGVAAIKPR